MNTVQAKSERRSRNPATTARHQELRERLIVAAEAAIDEAGVSAVRARSLAETVGCSVGAIYDLFPDLDALILAVNGRTLDLIDAVMGKAGSERAPAEHMESLAQAYLSFAASHRRRWAALFEHRMPQGRPVTPSYAEKQSAAFRHIETPLALLRPKMSDEQRALLARTLFSAVHGMVALGLDEKVAAMPLPVLREQVRLVVAAIANGLMRC